MKKVISLFLVTAMMLAMFTVSFSASFSVSDKDEDGNTLIWSAKDALAAYEEETGEEVETSRIYFLMPNGKRGAAAEEDHYVTIIDYKQSVDENGDPLFGEDGEPIMEPSGEHDEIAMTAGEKAPSWYNEYNVLDGKHYAACYWWGGTANPENNYSVGWCGYRAEIEDYDQGIYYIDLPNDVTTIIWNNGVNGGMDSTLPIYYEAAQTIDTNSEGAYPGDYDTLIDGSPDPDYFDQCIYVINPDRVDVNPLTNKQTCGADWYVYYGNGCYGSVFEGGESGEFTTAEECCLNPNHWKNGVHVGYYEEGGDDEHTHTPGEPVKENEVAATYKSEGSYDEVVYCTECGEEISREHKTTEKIALDPTKLYFDATSATEALGWDFSKTSYKIAFHIYGGDLTNGLDWGAKKSIGTASKLQDGLFEIDPVGGKQAYTLNPGVQYKIIFSRVETSNWKEQTYDLLFTTDCLGHVAYVDGTQYENPVDSTKSTAAAFWYGMDASKYGPVLQISSIGNVVGTCPEEGKTPESIFTDFIAVVDDTTGTTKLDNARKYVVDVNTKTEQKLIDDIGEGLGLTKQQVYDAFTTNSVETVWDHTASSLPGDVVIPTEPAPTEPAPTEHIHTPGAPVQENLKPATCTAEGSYDEVVYCTECGEEISRETKTIAKLAHDLTFVAEVPATEEADGVAAHYVCSACGKLFSDATGATEVTAADLVIPKLQHTHVPGEAVQENVVEASCTAEGSYDEVVYCTICGEEISRDHVVVPMTSHSLKRVNGKAATDTTDGWISHYECKVCGKYFADPAGSREVTWEQIVKPKLVPDPTEPEPTQPEPTEPKIDGILGDIDNTGVVDIIDVTIIQRVDLGVATADDEMKVRGDVDKDKSVTITDATFVQRWLVGIDTGLGIGAKL